jgi:N-methylhydantoinase A
MGGDVKMSRFVIGIDIGGTFTDGVAVDLNTNKVVSAKLPTTSGNPFQAVSKVLDELAQGFGTTSPELLSRTAKFAHGTTLTSNVLLERRGARTALIATQGFGDSILMMSGKGRVAGLSLSERRHFRATNKPDPIVPRDHIVEVPERVDYAGDIVVPLAPDAVKRAVSRLSELDVESCAVALLWSFRNQQHEGLVTKAIKEAFPSMFVTASSDVAPLLGEYERTATAVVNAYVGPAVSDYLETVENSLRRMGLQSPLLVLQASGGVAEASETEPVNTIESGPAAGVVGSVHLLSALGYENAIATDVGGTTFKVTVVREGEPTLTTETVLGQYSLLIPMVDVVSIGAGGGSIAWLDGTRLRVGPKSAGSDPGPACYGWGGKDPTVTDADLVLGFLNADYFLGGQMSLSMDRAHQAIRDGIANPLFGGDVVAAAAGIREVIDTKMADLIRKATLERGHDPREFVLLAYGGAGPVHCGTYAAELGCPSFVVPSEATVYSALGAAVSDLHHSFLVSRPGPAPGDPGGIRSDVQRLEERAVETLRREGIKDENIRLSRWAGMRYLRQFFELRIPVDVDAIDLDEAVLQALVGEFEREYERRYGPGAGHGEERVEYIRFGIDAIGETEKPRLPELPLEGYDADHALKTKRPVYWRESKDMVDTRVYSGPGLKAGNVVEGPAVIEHVGTTIAVHPGQRATIDEHLNAVITLEEQEDAIGGPRHL